MLYLAKVKTLEFLPKPDVHTVTYHRVAKSAEFDDRAEMNNKIEHVIASSHGEAEQLLRQVIQDYLASFVAAKLNPVDFRFTMWVEPVKNNRLWISCSHSGGTHSAA